MGTSTPPPTPHPPPLGGPQKCLDKTTTLPGFEPRPLSLEFDAALLIRPPQLHMCSHDIYETSIWSHVPSSLIKLFVPGKVRTSLVDTGIHFPNDELDQLFSPERHTQDARKVFSKTHNCWCDPV